MKNLGQKLVCPFLEVGRRRSWQIESSLEDFSFPLGEQLPGDALVNRVSASAKLSTVETHSHLPIFAVLLLKERAHATPPIDLREYGNRTGDIEQHVWSALGERRRLCEVPVGVRSGGTLCSPSNPKCADFPSIPCAFNPLR